MPEEKKQIYRLFKVAKELNVGSATLVEHLSAKGFQVVNSPNEKLSDDMYHVLLRDFGSEKALKEKAEQIKEQKKEARVQREDSGSSHDEDEILSAEQLRHQLLDKKSATPPAAKEKVEPKKEPIVVQKPETPPVVVEVPEVKAPPVQEEPKVPVAETPEPPVADGPGLKVKGKIDLEALNYGKKGPRKKEEPAKQEPRKEAPPVVETPVVKEPVVEVPVAETPVVEPPVVQEPVVEVPVAELPQVEVKEGNDVIRASEHAPQLRGLNVLGRIELPTDKLRGRKNEPAAKTGTGTDSASEGEKKKRKRNRKKTPAVTPNAKPADQGANRGAGGGARGPSGPPVRGKKEELTDKEIQDKIKSTLAELEKRAGRGRQQIRRGKRDEHARRREDEIARRAEQDLVLEVTEFITANEFANLVNIPVTSIIAKCMELGLFVSINQRLEADVIQLLAEEYGFTVKFIDATETADEEEEELNPENMVSRPPIITVMGHVDHGKTSLLDYVRKANVIAGEAGGITQHIGAYEVTLADGRSITFLDTPGHEAFTAMRARGAKVTDLVIVVVAADDSVMPQTREAINHAQAANVPMIFAVNKIDKPGANPEKIREQLAQMDILVEDWGGKFAVQNISAKHGLNVQDLLDKVLLEAEILDLKADPTVPAKGTVIEARVDKGRGVVTTFLVQQGTLRIGDTLVAGVHFGKVKAMMDERGNRITEAGPSTPVQVLGMVGTPQAGDTFRVYVEERKAKEIAQKRTELYREQSMRSNKHITLDEIARRKAIGDFKELNIIVKGDVDGSVEALSDSLLKLSNDEVKVNIIMKGVGQISESDVLLASASDAVVIGFQVRPSPNARRVAENEAIDIRLYRIIYDAINDVKDALEGMLSPEIREEIIGTTEIREVFKITKVGSVAGCMVTDGKITRNDPIRLIRDGIVAYEGKLSSLKRFKDDAKEVNQGFECGLTVDGYNDLKVGDIVESYRESEVKRSLK
jgi:translation initiation factor IF-2